MLLLQFHFPGMTGGETALGKEWIRKHAEDYDRMEFNVRLGRSTPIDPNLDESIQRQNEAISRKRADIIAYAGGVVDIIELKDRARLGAIGQLIGYKELWQLDQPDHPVRQLIVVARYMDANVETVYRNQNVIHEIFPFSGGADAAFQA